MKCPTCGAPYPAGARYCIEDGAELAAVAPSEPLGAVIDGRYRLLSMVGAGGAGTVYKAQHTSLPRQAAVKIIQRGAAASESEVTRFLYEVQAVAALEHPNIVPLYDAGHDPVFGPYMAMRLLRGEDLGQRLQRDGALPLPQALYIVQSVAAALQAAHALGIVHRDVKPLNIFLEQSADQLIGYDVRLLDFGIATAIRSGEALSNAPGVTGHNMVVGSLHTISPEAAMGHAIDARADIYALGVCFYVMLTGVFPTADIPPEDALVHRLTRAAPPPSTRTGCGWIPRELDGLVGSLLAIDPDGRPATCAELVEAIARRRADFERAWAERNITRAPSGTAPWQWETEPNDSRQTRVAPPVPPRHTVLVADDEPAIVDLVRLLLEDAGYGVVPAIGGREALAAMSAPFSAVVIDIMMPDIDGTTCIEQMRAGGFLGPIVVLTALRSPRLHDDLADKHDAHVIDKVRELQQLPRLVTQLLANDDPR